MEKAIIVTTPFNGFEEGYILERDLAEKIDQVNGFQNDLSIKVEIPEVLEDHAVVAFRSTDDPQPEFWFKDGEILAIDPEDDSWSYHPATSDSEATWQLILDVDQYKKDVLDKLFSELESEVITEMKNIFGAGSADSAVADEATYKLWSEDPAFYAGNSLIAKASTTSYSKGVVLDSEADIKAYADEMLLKIKTYALWRKTKERDFSIKKASIENS